MTTNSITTSTLTINIDNTTDNTIHPNTYIPTTFCSKCQISKELTKFNKQNKNNDGNFNHCKNCINN